MAREHQPTNDGRTYSIARISEVLPDLPVQSIHTWIRAGVVKPGPTSPGVPYRLSLDDLLAIALVRQLVKLGVPPSRCAQWARTAAGSPHSEFAVHIYAEGDEAISFGTGDEAVSFGQLRPGAVVILKVDVLAAARDLKARFQQAEPAWPEIEPPAVDTESQVRLAAEQMATHQGAMKAVVARRAAAEERKATKKRQSRKAKVTA